MQDFPTVRWGNTRAGFLPVGADLPNAPTAAALVFAMLEDAFVLADIAGRGWCIPGGRLEPGESAEQAARREAWEEIGATLGLLALLGHYVLTPAEAKSTETKSQAANSETQPGVSASNSDPEAGQNSGAQVVTPHVERTEAETRLVPAYLAPVLSLTDVPPGSESRGVRQARLEDLRTVYYTWDALLEAMFAYAHEQMMNDER